ncbi:unnamed protein product, partial [Discosporangium mesarthrocarpum]
MVPPARTNTRSIAQTSSLAPWPAIPVVLCPVADCGKTHGLVATVLSSATISFGWDSTLSTAASVSFFVVDSCVMIANDLRPKAAIVRRETGRAMDYGHHVIGVVYGTFLLYFQRRVCS